jgi:hypothetical protein
MKKYYNWIVIAGNGRNTGKTTLACKIIAGNLSSHIVGIKISPHHHPPGDNETTLIKSKGMTIMSEKTTSRKDSGRMLKAGAEEVLYVQAADNLLPEVLEHLEKLVGGRPTVCESGGIVQFIDPGLFLMVMAPGRDEKPGLQAKLNKADMVTDLDEISRNIRISEIHLINNEWKKTQVYDII